MGKSGSFGDRLQKRVDEINRRTQKNFVTYVQACQEQGKKVGEPIGIMALLGSKKK